MGHFDSKNGTNAFPKTESESWGLPLMNGGLKTKNTGVEGYDATRDNLKKQTNGYSFSNTQSHKRKNWFFQHLIKSNG